MDQFINRLADDHRLRQHGLDDVRKELLAASAAAYQRFAQQRGQDTEVMLAWARANRRLAAVTSQIALKQDALKLAQEAVTVFEKLAGDRPHDVELQLELAAAYIQLGGISIDLQPDRIFFAACLEKALAIHQTQAQLAPDNSRIGLQLLSTLTALGGTYRDQGSRAELSRVTLEKALQLARQLAAQHPANDACARGMADVYLNLGFLHARGSRWQQSVETYRESLGIYENLARKNPTDMRVHSELAENRSWLANVLAQVNRRTEALALLDEARKFQETLIKRHAVVNSDRTKLATTYRYLGHVERDAGNAATAIEWYGKAIALHESVLKQEPQRDRNAMFLVDLLLDRAECLARLGQSHESEADWQHALQRGRTQVWRSAVQRAGRLVRLGDLTMAEALVEKLLASGFNSGDELGRLARIYSLASAVAPADEGVPHHFASRAIELLRDARDLGWLEEPANQRLLQTHADFQVLRFRTEFQYLVASMSQN